MVERRVKAISLVTILIAGLGHGMLWATSAYSKPKRERAVVVGSQAAFQIIALTNRERAKHGVPPLKFDRACALAIAGHVNDMAKARYLSHQGRDGRGASERYLKYKLAGRGAGENIAYNTSGTAESFMRQWLRSPGHRGNILSAVYKGIGASVQASCHGRGGKCYYYAGQCFSP